jgi:hypothetical protein
MRIQVLVYRHDLPATCFRLISADVPEGTTADGLRDRIKAAVTQWFQAGSEDAQQAAGYAGDDFNIGDMCNYDFECGPEGETGALAGLGHYLKQHGVENLEVIEPDEGDWSFDTPLVDSFVFDEDEDDDDRLPGRWD